MKSSRVIVAAAAALSLGAIGAGGVGMTVGSHRGADRAERVGGVDARGLGRVTERVGTGHG